MMTDRLLAWAFWVAVGAVLYTYAGYPLALLALARLRPRPVRRASHTPCVSLIVTAHNEAARIGAKLDNCLALDYPKDKLEVLVASDGSTDDTGAIVARYADRKVRLVRSPKRVGKTAAQNLAVAQAGGEVLVLSDVSAELAPGALRAIVRPFADPEVGLVSGEDVSVVPVGHAAAVGESLYVRYEMWLRRLETATGSLVGASGSFYAVRRALRAELKQELIEDFALPLLVLQAGKRVVAETEARAAIPTTQSPGDEFRRRVRIQVGGAVALGRHLGLLNPLRFPRIAWGLVSHKVLRWLMPLWWAVALAVSLLLAPHSALYAALAGVQGVFYLLALAGWCTSTRPRSPALVGLPFSLTLATVAMGVGLYKALRGERAVVWEPSRRGAGGAAGGST